MTADGHWMQLDGNSIAPDCCCKGLLLQLHKTTWLAAVQLQRLTTSVEPNMQLTSWWHVYEADQCNVSVPCPKQLTLCNALQAAAAAGVMRTAWLVH